MLARLRTPDAAGIQVGDLFVFSEDDALVYELTGLSFRKIDPTGEAQRELLYDLGWSVVDAESEPRDAGGPVDHPRRPRRSRGRSLWRVAGPGSSMRAGRGGGSFQARGLPKSWWPGSATVRAYGWFICATKEGRQPAGRYGQDQRAMDTTEDLLHLGPGLGHRPHGPAPGPAHRHPGAWAIDTEVFENSHTFESGVFRNPFQSESGISRSPFRSESGTVRNPFQSGGFAALREDHGISLSQAPVPALAAVIDHEHPDLSCRSIDLPLLDDVDSLQDLLINELLRVDGEQRLALRGGRRYALRLLPHDRDTRGSKMIPASKVDDYRLEIPSPGQLPNPGLAGHGSPGAGTGRGVDRGAGVEPEFLRRALGHGCPTPGFERRGRRDFPRRRMRRRGRRAR